MKKIVLALAAMVCSTSIHAQVMKIMKGDEVIATFTAEQADQVVFEEATALPTDNGHEYVDLGLPSGLMWATCNVGSSSPEGYGDYFAWGETAVKDDYSLRTYKWMEQGYSDWHYYSKYTFADGQTSGIWYDSEGNFIGDNKTVLDPEDDAAHVNWGGSWRMPTKEEVTELTTECTWTWTTQNGVNGYEVVGPNGNAIFLPAAGDRFDSAISTVGYMGYYWSASLDTYGSGYANTLRFEEDKVMTYGFARDYGHTVRPVR